MPKHQINQLSLIFCLLWILPSIPASHNYQLYWRKNYVQIMNLFIGQILNVHLQLVPSPTIRWSCDFYATDSTWTVKIVKKKHCQRHNGPRVLSLKLELSLKLKWIQIQFSQKGNSGYRLNTLGPLCLWQCLLQKVAHILGAEHWQRLGWNIIQRASSYKMRKLLICSWCSMCLKNFALWANVCSNWLFHIEHQQCERKNVWREKSLNIY